MAESISFSWDAGKNVINQNKHTVSFEEAVSVFYDEEGIVLGGSLQMIALGWANIGAAIAPDAALASVASAIILVLGGQGAEGVSTAIAVAIPLAFASSPINCSSASAICLGPATRVPIRSP